MPIFAKPMLSAAFFPTLKLQLNMSNVKLEIKLPAYAIKHIEKVRVLFAVNADTKEVEPFVPMSLYLDLLSKVESLESKQAQYQLPDRTNI